MVRGIAVGALASALVVSGFVHPVIGVVSGVVIDSQSSAPMSGALVRLKGADVGGRATFTDDAGRFQFDALPRTTVTIVVSKPAYLSTEYGSKGPARPGLPVVVGGADDVTDLLIRISRGGVISGTVSSSGGDVVPGAQIAILRLASQETSSASLAQALVADDIGQYRAFGLAPGRYLVAASDRSDPSGGFAVRSTAEIDRLFREQEAIMANVAVVRSPALRNDVASSAPVERTFAYSPTYFPGTVLPDAAQIVDVAAESEMNNVSVVLAPVATSTVTGFVSGSSIPAVDVSVTYEGPQLPGRLAGFASRRLMVNGQQEFSFSGLLPGRYKLLAVSADAANSVAVPQWAAANVEVQGTDLTGVALQLRPAVSFTGRVSLEATAPRPALDLSALKVHLIAVTQQDTPIVGPRSGPGPRGIGLFADVQRDGVFRFPALLPGRYSIEVVGGERGGWWLRSAELQGRDLLDSGLEVAEGAEIPKAVLILSQRHTRVEGHMLTVDSRPAAGYSVFAVPADPSLRTNNSRRVTWSRVSSDGSYVFSDLPPGDYFLAAVVDVPPPEEWQSPVFLGDLAASGVRVSVTLGGTVRQDLKLASR